MFSVIPSWDALHPLIIHFPIALLLVAPILVLLGMLLPRQSRGLYIAAFCLMVLGTISTYVAASTGEAAGELAERTAGVEKVLKAHEGLAETTQLIFTALTGIFAAIVFAPSFFKRSLARKSSVALNVAFLLFYAAGALVLVNVAHQGGRLVHEFGVRAMVTSNPASNTSRANDKEGEKQNSRRDDNE